MISCHFEWTSCRSSLLKSSWPWSAPKISLLISSEIHSCRGLIMSRCQTEQLTIQPRNPCLFHMWLRRDKNSWKETFFLMRVRKLMREIKWAIISESFLCSEAICKTYKIMQKFPNQHNYVIRCRVKEFASTDCNACASLGLLFLGPRSSIRIIFLLSQFIYPINKVFVKCEINNCHCAATEEVKFIWKYVQHKVISSLRASSWMMSISFWMLEKR